MFETQTALPRMDELYQCRDRFWLSRGDENCIDGDYPQKIGRMAGMELEALNTPLKGSIHIGQRVFSLDHELIGLTTKLLHNMKGQVTHVAIRGARLFGRHKMVPITVVSHVSSFYVLLSIDRKQFQELPEYRNDLAIVEEVDRALWKDEVFRNRDYHQIEVQVRDGILILNGYVISGMSQRQIETAVKDIPGILGIRSYLIADDYLLLRVAEALAKIDPFIGNHIHAQVQNGVVVLSGHVISTNIRGLAEQYASNVASVRGVINNIEVTGIDMEPEDQRFLQPVIGERFFFEMGCLALSGMWLSTRKTGV